MPQPGVRNHPQDRFGPQRTATDDLVPILMAAHGIFGIIDMHGLQTFQTDHPVEFREDTVQVVHDIVSSIVHMAGVQANTQAAVILYTIQNGPELLETPANLRTLPGHGLQQHCGGKARRQ